MVRWGRFMKGVREGAATIAAVAAAATALWGFRQMAGTQATGAVLIAAAAVLTVIAVQMVLSRLDSIAATQEVVKFHLEANGHDVDLPEELRGQATRSLVIASHVQLQAGRRRFEHIEGDLRHHRQTEHGMSAIADEHPQGWSGEGADV